MPRLTTSSAHRLVDRPMPYLLALLWWHICWRRAERQMGLFGGER